MQEKSKESILKEKEGHQTPAKKPEIDDDDNWEKDQKKRNYYYDDAHGYQKYVPEEDDSED